MPTINAYGTPAAAAPLEPMTIERREPEPHDVNIEIHYTGICHADIYHVNGEWRDEPYPLVPGHGIAGVVAAVGDQVTKHAVGERVGVGCIVGSCGECASCRAGRQQSIAAEQINEAYKRVLASDVRYRFAIDMATLKGQ